MPQPYTENYSYWGMLGAGEIISPRKEHTNWLFNPKWSALKTHIQLTLYRLNILFTIMNVYTQTFMYTGNINEKDTMNLNASIDGIWKNLQKGQWEKKCPNYIISSKL